MIASALKDLCKYSQYGGKLLDILSIFVPLALQLPQLRNNPTMMEETVKSISINNITDVATRADLFVQEKLKREIAGKHPDWQFWGEEGEDNVSEYDPIKKYLLVSDPIEGTNNFKAEKDNHWGSVVALVDIETKEPIIGIVALPAQRRFYLGIKGSGAYIIEYDDNDQVKNFTPMPKDPEYNEFTYNNSPHFEPPLAEQVQRFFSFGNIQPDASDIDDLDKSRKKVNMDGVTFIDPESGALEAIRNRGTIYFKTSNEMAAVFVILNELGSKITDTEGKVWTLGINTLIAARNEQDYNYLKNIYNKTRKE